MPSAHQAAIPPSTRRARLPHLLLKGETRAGGVGGWQALRANRAPPPPQRCVPHHCARRREKAEQEAWEGRVAMLRAIALQLLVAIDFIHSADTVHGSISRWVGRVGAAKVCVPAHEWGRHAHPHQVGGVGG